MRLWSRALSDADRIQTQLWVPMVEDRIERKVTVILATDVVGYSNKIEQNEDQTL